MAASDGPSLVPHLSIMLKNLVASPYPVLPSPESTERRASVALVIRLNPSYAHWPPQEGPKPDSVEAFFAQAWTQHADPEVLFIKRANRKGDRWTSHIALPGGKRDLTDEDDKATAVRETLEEVGLDLQQYSVECGNLPQRLVTMHWGKRVLMVLCPYVFLLTNHHIPPLKLQPMEVAATHWVPLRNLLASEQRTVVFEDVAAKFANQETGLKKWMCQVVLGKMMFAAINLAPTESLHSFETPVSGAGPSSQDHPRFQRTLKTRALGLFRKTIQQDLFNRSSATPQPGLLLLWGLTLGVMADFLDLLPPHDALTLWTYPTFTPMDVRLVIWLMTYRFKNRKRAELQAGTDVVSTTGPVNDDAARRSFGLVSESTVLVDRPNETGLHGLGTGSGIGMTKSDRKSTVATMVGGYYDIVRKAVALALVGRAGFVVVIGVLAWRKMRSMRG